MAPGGAARSRAAGAGRRDECRRRDRRRRLHRALDRDRAEGARSGHRTSSCSRRSAAASARAGGTAASSTATGRASPRFRDVLGGDGALAVARASDGAVAAVRALGEDVWLREGGLLRVVDGRGAGRESVDRSVAAARELGVEEEAIRAVRRRACRALPLAASSGAASSTATAPRCSRRGSCARCGAAALAAGVRIHERTPRHADRGRTCSRRRRARVRAQEIVVATNAWGGRLGAARPAADAVRELRRPDGAACPTCSPRSAGRAARRSPTAGCSSTTSGRRADGRVLMGSGSGPIGFGGRIDRPFLDDAGHGRARRGRPAHAAAGPRRRPRRARVGRPDRRLGRSPARLRHRARARASTTGPATRGTASARAGWRARSSPRSRSAPTTSGRGCRSSAGRSGSCRRSRSTTSADGSCGRRCCRSRTPKRPDDAPRRRCASWRRYPGGSASESARARRPLLEPDEVRQAPHDLPAGQAQTAPDRLLRRRRRLLGNARPGPRSTAARRQALRDPPRPLVADSRSTRLAALEYGLRHEHVLVDRHGVLQHPVNEDHVRSRQCVVRSRTVCSTTSPRWATTFTVSWPI